MIKKTGEREIPKLPGTLEGIDIKHTQRYEWASSFTRQKSVYDIACGVGYGSLLLEALDYTGFDNSPETIEYANLYYGNASTTFAIADACAMPINIEPADVIISFETIEHLKEPERFLDWARGHCNILLISSPIRGSFGRSPYHLFEYRLPVFQRELDKYFSKVVMLVQKYPEGIIYPADPDDKGVALAICHAS